MKQHVAALFVILVAAVDTWFCVVDAVELPGVELNPIARWVIGVGGVEMLVAAKVAGTAVAVYVAASVRPRWRGVVLYSPAAVQLAVALSYLPKIEGV